MHRLIQFARFVLVGLIATAIQYGILALGVEVLGLRADISSGIGFALSAIVNYLLNHRFTFRSSRAHSSALWRFTAVAGVGLLLNVSLMGLLAERWRVQYLLAQVLVTAITLFWNFIGGALFSFADPPARTQPISRGLSK
jgi:putative flippase GtrA